MQRCHSDAQSATAKLCSRSGASDGDWTNCLESSFYIVSNKNLFQAERPTSGSCPAARLAMDDIDDDTSSIEASNFPKKKNFPKKVFTLRFGHVLEYVPKQSIA